MKKKRKVYPIEKYLSNPKIVMYTVKELADILRMNEHSIYNMLSKCKGYSKFPIKHVKIGRHIRFMKQDVEKYLGAKL